jgi:hypothetical protein
MPNVFRPVSYFGKRGSLELRETILPDARNTITPCDAVRGKFERLRPIDARLASAWGNPHRPHTLVGN